MRRLALLLSLTGCHSEPPQADPLSTDYFDRPQSVVFLEDGRLVVSNSGYGADGWHPGSLSIVSADGALLERVSTRWLNPQRLRRWQDGVLALSTGPLDLSDFDRPTASSSGGIEFFDGDLSSVWASEIRVSDAMAAPTDLVISNSSGLVASGVQNSVLTFAPETGAVDEPISYDGPTRVGLGSLAPWRGRFLLADFNEDRLFIIEPDGSAWPCRVELGQSARDLEGAQSIAVKGDTAYVVLALSGVARAVDLSQAQPDVETCGASVSSAFGPLGNLPNHLLLHDNLALVVHSGDHNVVAYDLDTGAETRRWVLDPGANPWHAAVDPTGSKLAVTEWGANALTLFDLESAERIWRLAPEDTQQLNPPEPEPPGPPATFADTIVFADGVSDPEFAIDGAQGGGEQAGGQQVAQLSGSPDGGDRLVIGWGGTRIVNGPGADLVVFENAFHYAQGTFMDPVVVEISADGETWVAFPHDYRAPDERIYSPDPAHWTGFAGVTPTVLHTTHTPQLDAFDRGAGGDRFDLDSLPDSGAAGRLKADGFSWVRLSSASSHLNPDTGAFYPRDPVSNGADIDAVYARYFATGD